MNVCKTKKSFNALAKILAKFSQNNKNRSEIILEITKNKMLSGQEKDLR